MKGGAMPSVKTGLCANPECPQAGEEVWIKGRGLCRACYNRKFREGTLDKFKPSCKTVFKPRSCGDTDGEDPPTTEVRCAVEETNPTQETMQPERTNMENTALNSPSNGDAQKTRKPSRPGKTGDFTVTVDFGPAAHLLEEIRRRAEEQMRPLAMQVLWELKQASQREAAV